MLCPGAMPNGIRWPSDEELLEIAIEDSSDARLVVVDDENHVLEQGPFPVDRSDVMPRNPWTVLIQSMEVWQPELHALYALLDFLPRWRFDDVMISLSSSGGGVGSHVDQYDVFLVQAQGRRRWSWGGQVHPTAEDVALRQVLRFEPTDHAELGPGDALYLPPGVPHDGVALSDGAITVSIGFRAPGVTDLLGYFADTVSEHWDDAVEIEPRLGDAGRLAADDPWAITRDDLTGMKRLLLDVLDNDEMTVRAFGEQVSLPRFPPEPPDVAPEPEELTKLLRSGWSLERWAGSRLFHHRRTREQAWLFADGISLSVPPDFAAWVARQETISAIDWLAWHKTPDALPAIMMMLGRGTFGLVPPNEEQL